MKYAGGKYRQARAIAEVILALRGERDEYVEPFMGGGAVASVVAPHFERARLSDAMPDLVMMWQATQQGWLPPSELTERQYKALRSAPASPLRAFAGFGCSFGGKWFGGYGRQSIAGGRKATETSLAPGSARAVARQAPGIAHAEIDCLDYRAVKVDTGCVVYADPPYAGVPSYVPNEPFDSEEFWRVAQGWAATGALVLVSEHAAPQGWHEVWAREFPKYLRGTDQAHGGRHERLFLRTEAVSEIDDGSVVVSG